MKLEPGRTIFWNVDTQVDFIEPEGKLYVTGAELIKPELKRLTELAQQKSIKVINTADFHYSGSAELSDNPDFKTTFPPHCMAETAGAAFIEETIPENPLVFDWSITYTEDEISKIKDYRNVVIRKDAFDVFKGNMNTDLILETIAPETVVVYGVTTNVCVNDAVIGLVKRVKNVFVVNNAIKELPNLPLPYESWKIHGVQLIALNDLNKLLD